MKFGIFDHVDTNVTNSGGSIAGFYDERLNLAALYDELGFHCYHVAEHHFTPLGYAPSPSLLLAAVARQTRRLRFGPLVYLLPLYHPLRLLEEICVLDQLSHGRLQLGVGRGVSPFEMGYYGVKAADAGPMYHEAFQVLMEGFRTGELTFKGRYYQYDRVPLMLHPVQRPHPPLWYGVGTPEATPWCAQNDVNIVLIGTTDKARSITDRYRAEWAALGREPAALPLLGVSRHVVVAPTDREARDIARRSYGQWRTSLAYLWRRHNAQMINLENLYPEDWDAVEAMGNGCAGAPGTVIGHVREAVEQGGVNYFCSWFQFGSMRFEESSQSATLFAEQVMPAFGTVDAVNT